MLMNIGFNSFVWFSIIFYKSDGTTGNCIDSA